MNSKKVARRPLRKAEMKRIWGGGLASSPLGVVMPPKPSLSQWGGTPSLIGSSGEDGKK